MSTTSFPLRKFSPRSSNLGPLSHRLTTLCKSCPTCPLSYYWATAIGTHRLARSMPSKTDKCSSLLHMHVGTSHPLSRIRTSQGPKQSDHTNSDPCPRNIFCQSHRPQISFLGAGTVQALWGLNGIKHRALRSASKFQLHTWHCNLFPQAGSCLAHSHGR